MKPRKKIAQARTPSGSELVLYEHDGDYYIHVDRNELMSSRRHESELELGRIGCEFLKESSAPRILIGGLGMGYTLRAALDMLPSSAEVVVAELVSDVIDWNKGVIGHLAGEPLGDSRVSLKNEDVLRVLLELPNSFDAILLDVDNGPEALSDSTNQELYNSTGIQALLAALKKRGKLFVWSAQYIEEFERRLMKVGFSVGQVKVKAHKNAKKKTHCIMVATVGGAVGEASVARKKD